MTLTIRRIAWGCLAGTALVELLLLLAAALIMTLAAVGAHEIAIHSQPCYWAMWPVLHCEVAR